MLSGRSLYVSQMFNSVLRHVGENGHCMQEVEVDDLPLVCLILQQHNFVQADIVRHAKVLFSLTTITKC